MKIVVLYHAKCTDGSAAMWAAWKHFQDSASYIAVGKNSKKQSSILNKCHNADKVYMCDMMLDIPDIESLLIKNIDVYLLDHHISNMDKLLESKLKEKYPDTLHDYNDLSRSGAGIAWDYFMCNGRPLIINYVEDFDLWRWSLPDGKSIYVYVSQFNWANNEAIITKFNEWENMDFDQFVNLGKPLLDYKNELMQRNLDHVARAKINIILPTAFSRIAVTYDVPIVNANQFTSETGNIMAQGESFAIIWQVMNNGKVRLSFRSDENGEDVSYIAANIGEKGGGHKHAASSLFNSLQDMLETITIYENSK